jgi:hypothetical protein
MTRKQDIDWSDWKGSVQPTEHPLSTPINPNFKKGADIVNDFLSTCTQSILRDIPKQPTNEQMFGHLVKTEAEVKAIAIK